MYSEMSHPTFLGGCAGEVLTLAGSVQKGGAASPPSKNIERGIYEYVDCLRYHLVWATEL